MKKGISDRVFPPVWKIEESLSIAKQVGFDGIELNVHEEEGILNLNTSSSTARVLAKQCNELGLEIPSLSTILHNQYSLNSGNAVVRKHGEEIALKMIELAEAMGAKVIQIVPGVATSNVPYDRAYELSQESLTRLASVASKTGLTIGLENVCNKFLPSPMEFARFLDEINHPSVQAYFDIGNAMATGYPEHWIHLLGNRIVTIHSKDYRLATGYFVSSLGGDVNWPVVIDSLRKIRFTGYIMSTPPRQYMYCPERLIETASRDLDAILELS